MKMKKTLALALAFVMILGVLAGCGPQITVPTTDPGTTPASDGPTGTESSYKNDALAFAPGTVLRMAVGYNSRQTGLFFDAEIAGSGIKLADGVTYNTGDLKPTWVEVQNQLGMVFEDKYQGNTDSKEFEYWKEKLGDVDMVSGTAVTLGEYGVAGSLVNIAEHLDEMPNFKAYLEANPIVRMSITSDTANGGIYFSPYFDGVNDIERMPLMRTDWVRKLLDGEGEFAAEKSGTTATPVYEPYMPTTGTVDVDVVTPDGSATETITKNYDAAGNIVAKMNAAGPMSGVEAVNMLRTYIDQAYDGYYGTTRSDLFIGQNAAWDADELVALLRCVVSNAPTLNGTDQIQGIFCREDQNNQRRLDMVHLAGLLFGVRGLESRKDYLYVDADGLLRDARQEATTYEALDRMNDLTKEGLISSGFVNTEEVKTKQYLENDMGFMHYDYNQTQTLFNEDGETLQEGEEYRAVMVPVARWFDGTDPNGVYMRFTESWRSVKTGGWAISAAGVKGNDDKLKACLALIDFAYTDEGMILLSYGPKAFRADTTFDFNGQEMPEISDACRAELWDPKMKSPGNYTNYARQYLGSTLSFVKCQSFEYQCTTEVGREGAGYISRAIALGTIKHPQLAVDPTNWWYTSVPTILPTSKVENDQINGFSNLGNTMFGASKDQKNLLVDIIVGGYKEEGMNDAASAAATVAGAYSGAQYLELQNRGWQRAIDFYNTIK